MKGVMIINPIYDISGILSNPGSQFVIPNILKTVEYVEPRLVSIT